MSLQPQNRIYISAILYSRMQEMAYKRAKKTLPILLTREEIQKLLKRPNTKCYTGLRNAAIMHLMLFCGLRRSEICKLQTKEIDTAKMALRITQGKGGKDRDLFIPESCRGILNEWEKKRKGKDYFFSTCSGFRLQEVYINQMIKTEGKKAGIEKRIYPHLLRHCYATEYYRSTKDIEGLRGILGHSDITTTTIYITLGAKDREAGMRAFKGY